MSNSEQHEMLVGILCNLVPERMSLINLYLFIRHLSGNQQKTERYDIAMWKTWRW